MKINRKELERELAILKKLTSKRHNLHICESTLMSFMTDQVGFQATDLSTTYTGFVGEGATKNYENKVPPGTPQILISVSKLMKAVKAIPKKIDEVSLEVVDEGNCLLVNGTITIAAGGKIEDYPDIPELLTRWFYFPYLLKGRSYDLLTYDKLLQASSALKPDKDEKRMHVTNLLFDTENGNIVSTDGNRLNVVKIPVAKDVKPFMMHKDVVQLLSIPQLRSEIGAISNDERHVFVRTGHGFISLRQTDEVNYPDYLDLLGYFQDGPNAVLATHDKQLFVDVLIEANGILSEDYRGVTLNMHDRVLINAVNPDVGEFNKDVSDDFTYTGDDIEVAINPVFFIEACKQLPDTGLNVQLLDNEKLIMIESIDKEFTALIMPIRI